MRQAADDDTAAPEAGDPPLQRRATADAPRHSSPFDPGPHDRVDGGGADDHAALNLDDEAITAGPGVNSVRTGGTANATGADSGRLGAPAEQLSERNGPSAPG